MNIWHNENPNYAALGASGGVSAVEFAAILFEPWQNLYLYGVIAIPQIVAGAACLFCSWYQDKKRPTNARGMAQALWPSPWTRYAGVMINLVGVASSLLGIVGIAVRVTPRN